jgi:inorganic triphosphatase YgiF
MMAVPIEHEVKLLAPEEFELPDMNGVVAGVSSGLESDAVYFDSPDLALARAGVTLRHRSGEPGPSWTVKFPANSAGSALNRNELRFEGDAHTVPAPARDIIRAHL